MEVLSTEAARERDDTTSDDDESPCRLCLEKHVKVFEIRRIQGLVQKINIHLQIEVRETE